MFVFLETNVHQQIVSRRLRRKRAEIRNYNHMNRQKSSYFNEIYNNNLKTNYNDINRARVKNYKDISSHEKCSVWINHDNYAVAELA